MEAKILTKTKGKMQDSKTIKKEYEDEITQYLVNGYEIKASNMTTDGLFTYFYTLLIKE